MKISSDAWKKLISDALIELGIPVREDALALFSTHAEHLIKWNKKINLTAITDPFEIAIKHYVDAVAIVRFIPEDACVLDIGSGGGFPGVPAKIMLPSADFTLIDAVRKKVNFIKDTIRLLKLENIRAHHVRAEAFKDSSYFDGLFDVVCLRAFSELSTCVEMAFPLLKEGGKMVAMKGRATNDELLLLKESSFTLSNGDTIPGDALMIKKHEYTLPQTDAVRFIVEIQMS